MFVVAASVNTKLYRTPAQQNLDIPPQLGLWLGLANSQLHLPKYIDRRK